MNRTLDDVIAEAVVIGPLSELPDRVPDMVRDFLAQKFMVALNAEGITEAERLRIELLWAEITGEHMSGGT